MDALLSELVDDASEWIKGFSHGINTRTILYPRRRMSDAKHTTMSIIISFRIKIPQKLPREDNDDSEDDDDDDDNDQCSRRMTGSTSRRLTSR